MIASAGRRAGIPRIATGGCGGGRRRIPAALRLAAATTTDTAATTTPASSSSWWFDGKTTTARSKSSSAFAAIPIPESVREAVKSTVLEEAVRPDSKLWKARAPHLNGSGRSRRSERGFEYGDGQDVVVNGEGRRIGDGGGVDDPISASRDRLPLLREDPLDEWHLDDAPSAAPSSTAVRLPDGVRPMSERTDPFLLSKCEMNDLSEGIRRDLIGSDHPVLSRAARYFFEGESAGGKKIRPMMVLLLSRAMALSDAAGMAVAGENAAREDAAQRQQQQQSSQPTPMPWQRQDLPKAQRRLAEISEMIHTASLFHDDVIDGADTRRGAPSVHRVFGNKTAILAGDYLLARASICLARLRDVEVVETMSTIIEHLVRGEVMQMRGSSSSSDEDGTTTTGVGAARERMVYYLRKNFYKTGSLMANSCKSAALLGGYSDDVVESAYLYGKHLGVAFQLVDDALDFEGSAASLGKPALADLNAGLATAPVLFAAEMFPAELHPLIERKFGETGDVETAVSYVNETGGIQRTKDLAWVHAELAMDAVMRLRPSAYRDALVHLAFKVVDRSR